MKFLKLLDPDDQKPNGKGLTIAQQALEARKHFPELVTASNLWYWKPGDPIASTKTRLLIGVAPTFSLVDMRLADIINDAVENRDDIHVDVFDIDDLVKYPVNCYFPNIRKVSTTPVVGIWSIGVYVGSFVGGSAVEEVFRQFSIENNAQRLAASVRPPSPELMTNGSQGSL